MELFNVFIALGAFLSLCSAYVLVIALAVFFTAVAIIHTKCVSTQQSFIRSSFTFNLSAYFCFNYWNEYLQLPACQPCCIPAKFVLFSEDEIFWSGTHSLFANSYGVSLSFCGCLAFYRTFSTSICCKTNFGASLFLRICFLVCVLIYLLDFCDVQLSYEKHFKTFF